MNDVLQAALIGLVAVGLVAVAIALILAFLVYRQDLGRSDTSGFSKPPEPIFHRFCDLPKGTRFKYPDGNDVWIAIETYRRGLIAKHVPISQLADGNEHRLRQSLCQFIDEDEGHTLQTLVEVLPDDYFLTNVQGDIT
jgi:hypothetical protein